MKSLDKTKIIDGEKFTGGFFYKKKMDAKKSADNKRALGIKSRVVPVSGGYRVWIEKRR